MRTINSKLDVAGLTRIPGIFQRFLAGYCRPYPVASDKPGGAEFAEATVDESRGWMAMEFLPSADAATELKKAAAETIVSAART